MRCSDLLRCVVALHVIWLHATTATFALTAKKNNVTLLAADKQTKEVFTATHDVYYDPISGQHIDGTRSFREPFRGHDDEQQLDDKRKLVPVVGDESVYPDLTPEQKNVHYGPLIYVKIGFMSLAALCIAVFYMRQQRVLGKAVERYIEQIDKEIIGVDIRMDSLWINPLTWSVNIRNVIIYNPKGYRSEYLVKADRLILTFDVYKYLTTGGVHVFIRRLILRGINVNFEKSLTTSNVKDIVHFLYYGTGTEELPPSGRIYSLQQVSMEDIKVRVVTKVTNILRRGGMRVPVADIYYSNFAEEVGDFIFIDASRLILQGLMRQVLGSNTSGLSKHTKGCVDDLVDAEDEALEEEEEDKEEAIAITSCLSEATKAAGAAGYGSFGRGVS